MTSSPVWSDVNLDRSGRSCGYLRVPHSVNDSGYGWIPVPIIVLKNDDGPDVLLMAGNHGDEYEGQVLLMKLAQNLPVEHVRGRLIILPGVNAPAVAAGTRISPIDDGNLNRLFPGEPQGTPTHAIAHYIDSVLLPQVRFCFDFHSGGYSLEYIPAAHLVAPDDPDLRAEAIGFLNAFAMPNSILIEGLIGGGTRLLGSCQRLGVGHMSTELGGAGSFSVQAYRAAEQGLRRLLRHVGVLVDGIEDAAPKTRFFIRQPTRDFVYAEATGVFEAYVELGDTVEARTPAGAIHCTDTPWRDPQPVFFSHGGTVLCKRSPARAKIGDCLFVTGTPVGAQ
ncbi:succinylglutamate desuccinylase/aspartoacylase family protein [Mesorhizobium sp. VK23B]|uniref:Succinylglutamate desuccinylase/aspartoacylase family protein n=1 Tax=Mesorhizobium dulcispinae TaxID=3072316 RepID=A0ABU4XP73_9HYPH|nr:MULTISPECIES: succinylglutamate desuccinylase/aspartoacylase family protein [unclassified Mesorhizobium]MDX8470174.1 succinylglutamate desuccinylase/aspartoacylase family protein [Mesorhizobium sp. VK23B]MDX8476550.1 succinylglutamate desuccinylase/aspartoacylase family protein [Mesorhizobium sp. VK23A]